MTGDHPAPRERTRLVEALRALERWGARSDWVGTDPYDGLNATRLVSPLRRSILGRRVLTQLVKRSPLDLRPALGIPRQRTPAAVAHVAAAYAGDGFLPPGEALQKLRRAVEMLDRLRSPDFEEPCWGYHFDVQTRVFFYPRGAPNTIATSFAGRALIDAYERTREAGLLRRAEEVGDFFLRHIPQTPAGEGAYFGYLVGDRTPIHNANMLVCALLARLHEHTGRDDFREAARAGVRYTLGHQRADGSWPYGEQPHLAWVDNFHSGYVLECALACRAAGLEEVPDEAVERGLQYYRRALFLPDGTPKYLSSSLYPIDIQCVAQGIQTFALASARDESYRTFAWTVFDYAMRRMRRLDGAFVFQRRRFWANPAAHVRWGVTPMLLAMTHLLRVTDA